jgi:uncharacterized membrane protein YkvI
VLRILKIYLLPGAVLQSVMIGGGYGTGRELVEFFTRHGMAGGLMGQILATLIIAAIFAVTLALSTRFKAYDYRSFFKLLLGRGWFIFELLLIAMIVLVLAVIGSAAGGIMEDSFGLPAPTGVLVMLVAVVILAFFGRDWITRFLATWSILLYAVFIAYFVAVLLDLDASVWAESYDWQISSDWMIGGLQYALYNASGIPIVLYAARAIETRSQAVASGVIGAFIAMIPGILFHLSFTGAYPGILEEAMPVYAMFESLAMPLLQAAYLLVLFGTFIETGAGDIQGLIERLDSWWLERRGRPLGRAQHAVFAAGTLIIASLLANFGIVDLIAEGYGNLAWGFLLVYLIPLFTVGIYRLSRSQYLP